ncbi:MAG: cytochrome c3 family protein, partial [Myxococcaceae bacterium]
MSPRLLAPLALLVLVAGCDNGFLTQQGYEPAQPIPFSHALHAGQFQMNCQYCHFGAAQSRHAGVPPAQLCLGCHAQVKPDAPDIQAL